MGGGLPNSSGSETSRQAAKGFSPVIQVIKKAILYFKEEK